MDLEALVGRRLNIKSYGKVTIYHDIVEPKLDGFWSIQSIVLPIDLCDNLVVEVIASPGIIINCTDPGVPTDESNLCHKSAALFLRSIPEFEAGLSITLEKRIPVCSGLGGGSSNASVVYSALNTIFGTQLSNQDMAEKLINISRDSYFFCYLKSSYVHRFADALRPLPDANFQVRCAIIDAKVPIISEKSRYVMSRVLSAATPSDVWRRFSESWVKHDITAIQKAAFNFLTPELIPEYSKAFLLKNEISRTCGLNAVFSGTGPFLVVPFVGDVMPELEQVCVSHSAELIYANVI